MELNFEELGFWFFEDDSKPLLKVDGVVYTVDGWNGVTNQFCRKVLDFDKKIVGHTLYCLTPNHYELNDEMEDLGIDGYQVSLY